MKSIIKNKLFKKGILVMGLAALLVVSSCKKFTELSPLSQLSESTAFSNPANIELAMNGVYNRAAVGNYNGGAGRGYPFGAASIEQSEMRGEDMVNLATFYQITYETTITAAASSANNWNMFINLYSLINQCNVVIDGVTAAAGAGTITQAVADVYAGEARFLRALAHHELVINFCRPFVDGNGNKAGVPYRTVAVTGASTVASTISLPRGTVAEVYTKILADLDFAETNLPVTRTGNGRVTRASKGAAIALKTRVKLHMNDFAGVITEGAKLGTGAAGTSFTSPIGNYSLTASPDGPFVSFSNNTESIFSIENGSAANGGVNGALPNMFGPASPVGTQVARGLVATSPNLYNASFWVTGDLRRSLLQIQQTTAGARYFFNYKYRDPTTSTDWAPIIRYAEVLLNVAEAYSRTTPLDVRALNLLNAVRNRSVPITDRFTIASFANQNSLTQAILNERRVEFAGEGRRWADITRLSQDATFQVAGGGIPAKVLVTSLAGDGSNYNTTTRPVTPTLKAAIPYTDFKYIWPIPQDELNANPNLTQNPGY